MARTPVTKAGTFMGAANLIRAKRKELKIGQGELAKRVGAHPQMMNKIERGEVEHSRFFGPIEEILKLEKGTLDHENGIGRAPTPHATEQTAMLEIGGVPVSIRVDGATITIAIHR